MASVSIYLNFNGNCEEAFNFYKSVFGGSFPYVGRYKDMPSGEDGQTFSGDQGEKIMHISLAISDGNYIMGSDTGGEWAKDYRQGNNFSISINAQNQKEADRIFKGLAEGGTITMPLNKTFWGDYFGMLTDKFGVNWMMSFNEHHPKK
jgi:PhnB protein